MGGEGSNARPSFDLILSLPKDAQDELTNAVLKKLILSEVEG